MKISTSGPLIDEKSPTPAAPKVSIFCLGIKEDEEEPPPGIAEEHFRELSELFEQEREARKMRREQQRRRAALVRQKNYAAEDEEGEPQHPSTSSAPMKEKIEQSPSSPKCRQSSVSVSFNSNVQMEKSRPRSSSDAKLLMKMERVALKTPLKSCANSNEKYSTKRNVKFGNVEMYKFGFAQGLDTVPASGCVSLGMEDQHHSKHIFQLDEYTNYKAAENKIKYHNWRSASQAAMAALDRTKRKRKLMEETSMGGATTGGNSDGQQQAQKEGRQRRNVTADGVSANAESESEEEVEGEEEEGGEGSGQFFEQCRVFEPLRRILLSNEGVPIDQDVANETMQVAESRVKCGCRCRGGKCVPSKCECAREGIKCQVDFNDDADPSNNFPCACTEEGCKNPEGRNGLDPLRIRNHFTQTLMRIRAAKRMGIDWDDEKNSPQHTIFPDAAVTGHKTPPRGDRKNGPMPSTVSTQMRPELAQIGCSPSSSSKILQSPDPFVSIRKRKNEQQQQQSVGMERGRDGLKRSMEIQEELDDGEDEGMTSPFPTSSSMLIGSSGETPKKRRLRQ